MTNNFLDINGAKIWYEEAGTGLPVIFENCPACFAKPQQRYAMKQMLAEQEKQHPRIFNSLLTAMRPLMGEPPA